MCKSMSLMTVDAVVGEGLDKFIGASGRGETGGRVGGVSVEIVGFDFSSDCVLKKSKMESWRAFLAGGDADILVRGT